MDTLLQLYAELAGARTSALPAGRERALSLLEPILADRSRQLVIAEIDGESVGSADMVIVANLTHGGMPWAIVENVVVAGPYRRQGVGTALLRYLIDAARAAGCCKLQLLSGEQRTTAHAFYRTVGLRRVAEGFKVYFDEA